MLGILIITLLSFILSLILTFLYKKFHNDNDKYIDYLPGYNCGMCGFKTCAGMSEAMLENVNNYQKCKPLKGEALAKMEMYLKQKTD